MECVPSASHSTPFLTPWTDLVLHPVQHEKQYFTLQKLYFFYRQPPDHIQPEDLGCPLSYFTSRLISNITTWELRDSLILVDHIAASTFLPSQQNHSWITFRAVNFCYQRNRLCQWINVINLIFFLLSCLWCHSSLLFVGVSHVGA